MGIEQILGPKEEIKEVLERLGIEKPKKHPNPLVHKILDSMREMFFNEEEGLYVSSNYNPGIFTETNAFMAIALQKAGYPGEALGVIENMKAKCRRHGSSEVFDITYDYGPEEAETESTAIAAIALRELRDRSAYGAAGGMKEAFLTEEGLFRCSKNQKQVISNPNAFAVMALSKLKDPLAPKVAKKMKEAFARPNKLIWNGWGDMKSLMASYHFWACLALGKAGEDITPYLEAAKGFYSEEEKLFLDYPPEEEKFSFYDNAVASITFQSLNDPLGKGILEAMAGSFLKGNSLFQDKKPSNRDEYCSRPNAVALLALIGYTF